MGGTGRRFEEGAGIFGSPLARNSGSFLGTVIVPYLLPLRLLPGRLDVLDRVEDR